MFADRSSLLLAYGWRLAVTAFGTAAFVAMEQVARADPPAMCCNDSNACTGCQSGGENIWVDVGTNAWKQCEVTTGAKTEFDCIVLVTTDVMGVPTGWCYREENATRYANNGCMGATTKGFAAVGPSSCKVGKDASTRDCLKPGPVE